MLHLGENGILDKNEGSTQIALVLSVRYLGVKVLQRDVRSLERKGVEGRGERTKRSYLGVCVYVCVCVCEMLLSERKKRIFSKGLHRAVTTLRLSAPLCLPRPSHPVLGSSRHCSLCPCVTPHSSGGSSASQEQPGGVQCQSF